MDIRKNKKSYVKEPKKRTRKKNGKSTVFIKKPKGRFVSFWCQILGFILATMGGITFFIQWIYALSRGMGLGADVYLMLLLFIVGMALFYRGYKTRKFHGRFRFYRRLLEDRESVSLEELSDMTGHKVKFLRQDLKKMIEQKMLLQGRLDQQEKYLFLTMAAYEDYVNGAESSIYEEELTKDIEAQGANEQNLNGKGNRVDDIWFSDLLNKAKSAKESIEKKLKNEVLENESNYNEFMYKEVDNDTENNKNDIDNQTNSQNFQELADSYLAFYELMQRKLKTKSLQRIITDFGVYTVRILAYDIETESRNRFLTYYLPLTKELLLSYEEMEIEGVSETATDLEDILNTIRYSFETFAGRLAEGEGMDVETDILALEAMLNR